MYFNIIKFHKIQENKLMQLQHFLSWNKVNIKHSCKSQLYKVQVKKSQGSSKIEWDYDSLYHVFEYIGSYFAGIYHKAQ